MSSADSRNVILLYNAGIHPALCEGLRRQGVELREGHAPEDADSRTLGCMVWFYDCLRHPARVWRLHRRLKKLGIPLIAWNQDAPHYLNRAAWRLDLLDRVRLLDIYATHTLVDTRRSFADTVLYLANAADTSRYHTHGVGLPALRDPARYTCDVSFFGALNGDRYKEMRARQTFFRALGARLQEQGVSFLFREAGGMSVEEQVKLIQSSRINLNFGASCDFGAPVASGLPERCYGIPASGGFLLCDRRLHASDDFSPGVNWAEFEGLEDCVASIRHWLDNFEAARELAEKCHHHVHAAHTYEHRGKRLLDTVRAWHQGKRGLIR